MELTSVDPRTGSAIRTDEATAPAEVPRLAAARGRLPEAIPFHAELGSTNPMVVPDAALQARSEDIAAVPAATITSAAGRLCTRPVEPVPPRPVVSRPGVRHTPVAASTTARGETSVGMSNPDGIWRRVDGSYTRALTEAPVG